MKRRAKISVCGIHETEDKDQVEVVSLGEWEATDTGYEAVYKDADGDNPEQLVQTTIVVKEDHVEIIKEGSMKSHMVFIPDRETLSYYTTPFGELEVSILTTRLECQESENEAEIFLEYTLEVNGTQMSNADVHIKIEALA